jgi:hypothetical protein
MRQRRPRCANLTATRSSENGGTTVASNAGPADTFPYPHGNVVGVLADADRFEDARRRLEESGFDGYEVLHGEEGLARIDLAGEQHGRSGGIMRRLQAALSDDADHVRRYAEYLRAGQYIVGVKVGDDKLAKQRAADALRDAQAEVVNYYADNYVEDLPAGIG